MIVADGLQGRKRSEMLAKSGPWGVVLAVRGRTSIACMKDLDSRMELRPKQLDFLPEQFQISYSYIFER